VEPQDPSKYMQNAGVMEVATLQAERVACGTWFHLVQELDVGLVL
jgi:hypothetical protein